MTRLFVLLYVGVLAALSCAWYIHGKVSAQRAAADRSRVLEEAHGGGARLLAQKLDEAAPEDQREVLQNLSTPFDYPITLMAISDLPTPVQRRIARGDDVVHFVPKGKREVVIAALADRTHVVQLGPFPDYGLQSIEESIHGWMRLTAEELETTRPDRRQSVLKDLRAKFAFAVDVIRLEELPESPSRRLQAGANLVFYGDGAQPDENYLAAMPLTDGAEVVRCGPFPSFERIEQKAAATTLGLVLLPTALAIALMLRPVAHQLRQFERAAKQIAAGELSTRVDARRGRATRSLAQAFNHMATRLETLVRNQRELFQAVSHELRTPLSRMRFAIDLVETAKDDAQRRERLASLDAAAEELDALVGELLSYVRMDSVEAEINRETIAVHDALETVIPKFSALHPSLDFTVATEITENDIQVLADRRGFQRVLGNLLSNAGRFAQAKVTISAASNPVATMIDIDDDGPGIAEADRLRVFEPFVRLDRRSKTDGGGVGLGLALVKRIMTQHGGTVDISTSPFGGCRMRTVWPKNGTDPVSK